VKGVVGQVCKSKTQGEIRKNFFPALQIQSSEYLHGEDIQEEGNQKHEGTLSKQKRKGSRQKSQDA